MNNLKIITGYIFIALLVSSNIFLLVEGIVAFSDETSFHFFANNKTAEDLDDGILAISVDKMNVLCVGLDNPVSVAACGVAADDLVLSSKDEQVSIKKNNNGSYIIHVSSPGKVRLTATNSKTGKSKDAVFRVKRLPDPVVRLGRKTDGLMGSGEICAQVGLIARLENMDIDASCVIQSYTLFYTKKRSGTIELQGEGGRFKDKISAAIKSAKPGDQYSFTNVRVKCPGDKVARQVNGLSFKIR